VGVFEMLRMTPTVQLAIERNASTAAIRRLAIREGMRPIWQDGLEKACLGLTTLDEVTNSVAGSLENDTAETGPVAQEGPEDQSSVRLSA
jgi:hypothetical protein